MGMVASLPDLARSPERSRPYATEGELVIASKPTPTFTVGSIPLEAALAGTTREEWDSLNRDKASAYAQYASPEWIEHLEATQPDKLLPPVVVRDAANHLAGIVPIVRFTYQLSCVVGGNILWHWRIPAVALLGSDPVIPADPPTCDRVLAAVAASAPEAQAIYLHSLPTNGFCWSHLQHSRWVEEHLLFHVVAGPRPFHMLELPSSFEAFVSSFPRKKRYNLARQVRVLSEHTGGNLRLQRIDKAEQVPMFTAAVRSMVRLEDARVGELPKIATDEQKARKLADAARRGMLRSYVLFAGDTACAVVLGYVWRHVFHYAEVAYHPHFSTFSPGTVLLYLLIGDLITHPEARVVNFGIGDASYKRTFGNVQLEDASVLLLRKGVANRLRRAGHSQFLAMMRGARRTLDRWPGLSKR
jgi:CelD/BcsL family acetyltransferase involved in cellulose biosynthesis